MRTVTVGRLCPFHCAWVWCVINARSRYWKGRSLITIKPISSPPRRRSHIANRLQLPVLFSHKGDSAWSHNTASHIAQFGTIRSSANNSRPPNEQALNTEGKSCESRTPCPENDAVLKPVYSRRQINDCSCRMSTRPTTVADLKPPRWRVVGDRSPEPCIVIGFLGSYLSAGAVLLRVGIIAHGELLLDVNCIPRVRSSVLGAYLRGPTSGAVLATEEDSK